MRIVTKRPRPRNGGVEVHGRMVVAVRGNVVALSEGEKRPKSTPAGSAGAVEREG